MFHGRLRSSRANRHAGSRGSGSEKREKREKMETRSGAGRGIKPSKQLVQILTAVGGIGPRPNHRI